MKKRLLQLAVLGALSGLVSLTASDSACDAAVVFRSGSAAYDEALQGIRETMSGLACRVHFADLQEPSAAAALESMLAAQPKLVITVGVSAYDQVRNAHPGLTVLPAVVLRADLQGGSKGVGAIYADVPLTSILERLHALYPKRTRVVLLHRPSRPVSEAAAKERARQLGMDLRIVECAGPDKLLSAFSSVKGAADFVIADADAELYNSATLKPLVLASLDQRIPIAGFSAAFVRAGALVGVYPDFRDLGRQAGELAVALLQGKSSGAEESVRRLKTAMNQQMVRLLGAEPARQDDVEVFK